MNTTSVYSSYLFLALLFDVAVPLVLMLYGVFPGAKSKLEWGSRLCFVTGYAASLAVIFPVFFLGWAWRAAVLLGFAGTLVIGRRRIKSGPLGVWRTVFSGAALLLGAAFWSIAAYSVVVGYPCPRQYDELKFPMRKGIYCVVNGGGSLWINSHHVPNQVYGLDIVRVNRWGKWADGPFPLSDKLSDYPTFGTDLYSPADGVILKVSEGSEDLPPGKLPLKNTAGNFILLGHGPYKILMGHLKQGSIRVHEGERVAQGQLLAQLGNSGHAAFPHLHISIATGGTEHGPYDGKGAAALYDGRFFVRNSLFFAREGRD